MSWWNKHKHDYVVLSETTTKSRFQRALEAIEANEGKYSRSTCVPHQLCHDNGKFIQILKCTTCGKIQRYVEEI